MATTDQELAIHYTLLKKAATTLDEVLALPLSAIIRDAAIKRFEYTFELAWKLFKRLAKQDGIEVNSPRQAIRAAFQLGIISDVDLWFEMLEGRNLTTHTYNEEIADRVFESAQKLPNALQAVFASVIT